jgi:hypothetical protein
VPTRPPPGRKGGGGGMATWPVFPCVPVVEETLIMQRSLGRDPESTSFLAASRIWGAAACMTVSLGGTLLAMVPDPQKRYEWYTLCMGGMLSGDTGVVGGGARSRSMSMKPLIICSSILCLERQSVEGNSWVREVG